MDRNVILTIGVVVGAILALAGLLMLIGNRFTQASEGSVGELFKFQGPVGVVVAALGVFLLVTCISKLGDESAAVAGSSSITPSATLESTSPTALPPIPTVIPRGVAITAPTPDQLVSSSEGVIVEGTASGLGSDTLWLFDFSEGPDGKPVYYQDTEEPLPIINGRWQYVNVPIGSPGPTLELITIAAIRANTDCNRVIRGLKPEEDGSVLLSYPLPTGCTQAADVRVIKNRA